MLAPKYKRKRRFSGQTIAETPVVLYTLFFFLIFPMVCMASTLYRAVLFYFTVRQAVTKAARSTTFTLAKSNAATVFGNDTWYATSGMLTLKIVSENIATSAQTFSKTKLAHNTINTSTYMYFIQGVGVGQITPLFPIGTGTLLGYTVIPGLTGPYSLTVTAQEYSEYPQGLWQ